MSAHLRLSALLAFGVVSMLSLAGCATEGPAGDATPGSSLGSLWPAPPEGEVIAQGTVMDVDGDVELCLGAVAESYPPQCSGLPLEGWTWDGVDGAETASGVTWGAYAVQGTFDGEIFTSTRPPIMLALYDPMAEADPTGGEPGDGDEATLQAITAELPDLLGDALLGAGAQDGRLWVDVVWDDGTWQDAADDDYGTDVVVIRSALHPVDG